MTKRFLAVLMLCLFPSFALADNVSEEVRAAAQQLPTELPEGFVFDDELVVEKIGPWLQAQDVQVFSEIGVAIRCPRGFDCRVKRKESFFSATNLLIGIGMAGGIVADVESTFSCINVTNVTQVPLGDGRILQTTRSCEERNPRIQKYVEQGRGATYKRQALLFTPVWVGSHYLRRSDNVFLRVVGWVAPIAVMAVKGRIYINNQQAQDWVRSGGN